MVKILRCRSWYFCRLNLGLWPVNWLAVGPLEGFLYQAGHACFF